LISQALPVMCGVATPSPYPALHHSKTGYPPPIVLSMVFLRLSPLGNIQEIPKLFLSLKKSSLFETQIFIQKIEFSLY